MAKTWLITGATSGFGHQFAQAALDRGDRVAATGRRPDDLAPLVARYGDAVLPLRLDVTDRTQVFAVVAEAVERFGRLDVVVNNAGFGHLGMVEELSPVELRDVLETDLLGAVWVTQAVLPGMRAQGGGRIMQVTSEGGVRAFAQFGAYHAAKWGLEGLTQALAQEVRGFGIRVVMIEPGPYATGFSSTGLRRSDPLAAYDDVRRSLQAERSGWTRGDPVATRHPVLELADAEDPPLRVFFGHSLPAVEREYAERLATWRAWQPLATEAFGRPVAQDATLGSSTGTAEEDQRDEQHG